MNQPSSPAIVKISVKCLVFSSIVLCLSITGLIMQASGTPWFSTLVNDSDFTSDFDNDTDASTYESQDWDECCGEIMQSFDSMSDEEQSSLNTAKHIFTSLTLYFVLLIIFSSVLILVSIFAIPQKFKEPLSSILGLAILTTGIFLSRKFFISLAFYFDILSNLYGTSAATLNPTFHLHVMIYFGGLVGIFSIISGFLIVGKNTKSLDNLSTLLGRSKRLATSMLLVGMMVYLVSPLAPIYHSQYDGTYFSGGGDYPTSKLVSPVMMLIEDDQHSAAVEYGYSDGDNISSNNQNDVNSYYSIVDSLYLALIWINLGILALLSLAILPRVKDIFGALAQLNILSVGILIPAIILTVMLYVCIPGISNDSESVKSVTFNANWIMPLACLFGVFVWIKMLITSHIPWWFSITNSNTKSAQNMPKSSYYGQPQMPEKDYAIAVSPESDWEI